MGLYNGGKVREGAVLVQANECGVKRVDVYWSTDVIVEPKWGTACVQDEGLAQQSAHRRAERELEILARFCCRHSLL